MMVAMGQHQGCQAECTGNTLEHHGLFSNVQVPVQKHSEISEAAEPSFEERKNSSHEVW